MFDLVETLIVEDGTIVANANSYVTLEQANNYVANEGANPTWDALDDSDKIKRLYQAQRYIEQKYSDKFVGFFSDNSQPLSFPRTGAVKNDGRTIGETEIPVECKVAQVEFALVWTPNDKKLYKTNQRSGNVKREYKKVDVITTDTEYFNGGDSGGTSKQDREKLNLALKNILEYNGMRLYAV